MAYQIIQLNGLKPSQLEQLGTKPKFWFTDTTNPEELTLFKAGRPGTGENWAEKVCCELCSVIGLPHAHYDLANCDGTEGVVSPSFTKPSGGRLVHGNELLPKSSPGRDGEMNYHAREHTVRRVMLLMGANTIGLPWGHNLPSKIKSAQDVFVGYLMLDALVGNQDRHFENWGLVSISNTGVFLAPTYDHASSLGRNETDQRREVMLNTRDKGQSVEAYVKRAKSMMYPSSGVLKKLPTIEAFLKASEIAPIGAHYWLKKLEALSEEDFDTILKQVPDETISFWGREFAKAMLVENRKRLLEQFKPTEKAQ